MAALTDVAAVNGFAFFPSTLTLSTSSTMAVLAGDIVCVWAHTFAPSVTGITFSDNLGNTWTHGPALDMVGSGSPDAMVTRMAYATVAASGNITVTATMSGSASGATTYFVQAWAMRGGPIYGVQFLTNRSYAGGTTSDDFSITGISQAAGTDWFSGEGRDSGSFGTDTWTWPDGAVSTATIPNQRCAASKKFASGLRSGSSINVNRADTTARSHIMAALGLQVDPLPYNPAQMFSMF